MASSDERREVAENLRYLAEYGGVKYAEQFRDELAETLLVDEPQDSRMLLYALADLIEPQKEGMCCDASDDGNVFECSRCGCVVRLRTGQADAFENVTYGPTLMMPNGLGGKLSFCPHCGCSVVSHDDN